MHLKCKLEFKKYVQFKRIMRDVIRTLNIRNIDRLISTIISFEKLRK